MLPLRPCPGCWTYARLCSVSLLIHLLQILHHLYLGDGSTVVFWLNCSTNHSRGSTADSSKADSSLPSLSSAAEAVEGATAAAGLNCVEVVTKLTDCTVKRRGIGIGLDPSSLFDVPCYRNFVFWAVFLALAGGRRLRNSKDGRVIFETKLSESLGDVTLDCFCNVSKRSGASSQTW